MSMPPDRSTTPLSQRLTIRGWLPPSVVNASAGRRHWSFYAKQAKATQIMAWSSAKQAGWRRVDGKARLTIVLVFPVKRRRDVDNCYSRCKSLVDGWKEWMVDDDMEHLDLRVLATVEPGVRETRVCLEAL